MVTVLSELAWGARRLTSDMVGVFRHADIGTSARYLRAVAGSLPAVIKTRSLVPADKKMAGRRCTFRPQPGTSVTIEGRDFSSAREIYCRRVYFASDGFDIHPHENVLDLGANIGLYSTMAAAAGARVVSVEAQSGFLPAIEANLQRNGVRDRAEIVHVLVGATTGVLSTDDNRRAASAWGDEPEHLAITDVMNRHALARIDLLKVDIEGSEFALFREESFLACVSRIAMEVHPDHGDVASLVGVLQRHGFRVEMLDSEGVRADRLVGPRGGYVFARKLSPADAPVM